MQPVSNKWQVVCNFLALKLISQCKLSMTTNKQIITITHTFFCRLSQKIVKSELLFWVFSEDVENLMMGGAASNDKLLVN